MEKEEKESLKLQVKEMAKKNNNSEDETGQCDGSRWRDTLKELEEKKTMYNVLKEKKEELSIYKNKNELLEEEVCKLKDKHDEELRAKDVEIKKLTEKLQIGYDNKMLLKDEKIGTDGTDSGNRRRK